MTKSCIKVWVSKMKDDHLRYLKLAKGELTKQSESESQQYDSEFL